MKKEKKEPRNYYHISSVSRMYNIHPQTLRLYEREGLLKPSRSEGNTRMYTNEDLRQLELILSLIRDMGVNLAGVEVVLNMRRRIEQIESGVNEFLEYVRQEFFKGRDEEFEKRKNSLVRISQTKIVKVNEPEA
jgi:MerR family transcriptional regulator/heat shock protein HspR